MTLMACLLAVFSQLTGINSIIVSGACQCVESALPGRPHVAALPPPLPHYKAASRLHLHLPMGPPPTLPQ